MKHLVYIVAYLKNLEIRYKQNTILNASRIIILNHYEQVFAKRIAGITSAKTFKISFDLSHFNAIHASFQIFYDYLPETERNIFREDFVNNYIKTFNDHGFFRNLDNTNINNTFFN